VIFTIFQQFLQDPELDGQRERVLGSDVESPQQSNEIYVLPVDLLDADLVTAFPKEFFHSLSDTTENLRVGAPCFIYRQEATLL
jgi:hypothetical protein